MLSINIKSQNLLNSSSKKSQAAQQTSARTFLESPAGSVQSNFRSVTDDGQDLEVKMKVLQTENETLNRIVGERGREIKELKKYQEEHDKMEENVKKLLLENEKLTAIVQSKD